MQKRIFVLITLGALLVSMFVVNGLVTAAPPAQDPATETPRPTRDPIRQATRRATRGLPPLITLTPEPPPQATEEPTAVPTDVPPLVATAEPFDAELEAEAAEAVDIVPSAPGPMSSGILVFNPDTSGAATVQVDVYDASGAVAYSTTVTVSANGAKMVGLPASLGTAFQGGAQISSDKNVEALVIGSNANNTARDAYEGTTAPALQVILPFVRHLSTNTQRTLVAVQNTTGTQANVTVTFYNLDGSAANTQNLLIAAHRTAYLNTDLLFTGGTFVGSARINSNQNVAVAAQTLYFKDTAAFDGTTASEADTTLLLSQAARKVKIVGGAVNWSEIFVRNNGGGATDVTLDFYSASGTLVHSTTTNGVQPNGTAQFMLNEPAFDPLGSNYNGWVKIRSSGEPLTATALQAMNKGKRLYSVNATANSVAGTRYVCGDTARTATNNTRLSILNTSSVATTKAVIQLFDKTTGTKVAQSKVTVLPNTSATVLLSDSKFSGAGTNYQGMAVVKAKGGGKPNLIVSVTDPYANPTATGTTGYTCTIF